MLNEKCNEWDVQHVPIKVERWKVEKIVQDFTEWLSIFIFIRCTFAYLPNQKFDLIIILLLRDVTKIWKSSIFRIEDVKDVYVAYY